MINQNIIKFAADTTNYGIKKNSNVVASIKNKICGDKITVELEISGKIIKKMNYETDACIYCQASASLLSKSVKNKKTNFLPIVINNVKKNRKFKELLKNKERINCIMLPFEAMQKAINNTK